MLHIYCLLLENNKYYIGKTENIKFRLGDRCYSQALIYEDTDDSESSLYNSIS